MKPFNLEEALSGKPVVTRSGLKVTTIKHFKDNTDGQTIAAVIHQRASRRTLQLFYNDGSDYESGAESEDDLFMASEKRTIWLNVYPNSPNEKHGYVAAGFVSELTAKAYVRDNVLAIAIPVEVEI